MAFNERDCFTQKTEMKPMHLRCPLCKHEDDYPIKWVRHTKKDRIPGGAQDPGDKQRFEKLQDYLYRTDDVMTCSRCRRRFDIPSQKNVVFV